MRTRNTKICRFCLGTIYGNKFEPAKEITGEILDVLLLPVNLDITKAPLICDVCGVALKAAFDFKSTCLETENLLSSFESNREMDLKKVYLKLKATNNEHIKIKSGHIICRLCFKPARDATVTLSVLKKSNPELTDVLEKYFSDVSFNAYNRPILCSPCITSLNKFLTLLTTLRNTEENISKYIEIYGTKDKGQIELSNVQESKCKVSVNQEYHSDADNDTGAISFEKEGENFKIGVESKDGRKSSNDNKCVNSEATGLEDDKLDIVEEETSSDRSNSESNAAGQASTNHTKNRKRRTKYRTKPRKMTELKCNVCPYRTYRPAHLVRHSLIHKSCSEVHMYECDKCEYKTKEEYSFRKHSLQHVDQSTREVFRCDSCSFKTLHKYNYKKHMLHHTNPSEVPVYKCKPCQFQTLYKRSYEYHMLSHKDESEVTLLKCHLCDFTNRHRESLARHMIVHRELDETKMYKCDTCDYKGKSKTCLRKHVETHKPTSEVNMYQCSVCSYESRYRYVMKSHELIHKSVSEVTMYECDSCTYQSRFKNRVQIHKKIHQK